MDKIVVVSTDANADYYFYSPYIHKAWNKLGWKVACMITHETPVEHISADYICRFPRISELRDATIAQTSRLYAAHFLPKDALLMTSDMDLLPLSDYWHPEPDKITNYGHDLTGYSYMPMGYTAMIATKWIEVMQITHDVRADMIRDTQETKIAYSDKWEEWWNVDWDLLTKRLQPYKSELVMIKRGNRAGSCFAYGRIDRGDSCQIPQGETLIDMHCENNNVRHPDKLNKFLSIFEKHYGRL